MAKTRDKLIPYLDLFDRLSDDELARVTQVDKNVIAEVRGVAESIYDPLREYEKLLETLDDSQLCKLFGFPKSAANIWRHCRASDTVKAADRKTEGLFDEMMGEEDDLVIVLDDEPPETGPPEVSLDDDGWGDL